MLSLTIKKLQNKIIYYIIIIIMKLKGDNYLWQEKMIKVYQLSYMLF